MKGQKACVPLPNPSTDADGLACPPDTKDPPPPPEKPDLGNRQSTILMFLIQPDQIDSQHKVSLSLLMCDTPEAQCPPPCQQSHLLGSRPH